MSPEYAVHGLFSAKSDLFSFGIILLQIESGWKMQTFMIWVVLFTWHGGYGNLGDTELMDPTVAVSCLMSKHILRSQVSYTCPRNAEDRPNMSDVVLMLSNEGAMLPTPKQPSLTA
ncbi:Protein kinase [Quillaja saponaria]|uniref:Protein kinase n=1 Tax=Quillaja saponaria TaxID=32244 RepID=A0AAD7PIP8_QUISA|nr:Protein kinase [Quillaja saponaria]